MTDGFTPLLTLKDAVAFACVVPANSSAARDAAASALLSSHAGTELRVIRRASGRPALALPARELGVSISHRHGVMLCGYSADHDVGVDIEWVDDGLDFLPVARDHFAPEEAAALNTMPDDVGRLMFFRLWSAKEAVLKATGRGIHDGLAHVNYSQQLAALGIDLCRISLRMPGSVHAEVTTRITMQEGRRYSTALALII